jgi:hypothetical protein
MQMTIVTHTDKSRPNFRMHIINLYISFVTSMPIKRSRSGWIKYLSKILSEIRVNTIKISTPLTKAEKKKCEIVMS